MREGVYSAALGRNRIRLMLSVAAAALVIIAVCGVTLGLHSGIAVNPAVIGDGHDARRLAGGSGQIVTSDYIYSGIGEGDMDGITSYDYYVRVGEQYLTARVRADYSGAPAHREQKFVGRLTADPEYEMNVARLRAITGLTVDEARQALLDIRLTERGFAYEYLLLLLCLPPLACIALAASWVKRGGRNRERLQAFINPDHAEVSFDREYYGADRLTRGRVSLTPGWIFCDAAADAYLLPANKLVWIYRTQIKRGRNGAPAAKGDRVTLCFCDGYTNEFMASLADAGEILDYAAGRYPNARVGFDAGDAEQWAKNRDAYIARWRQECVGKSIRV